jgi:hypothetical protein
VIVEDMPCISIGQLHLQPNEERPGIITSTDPAILYQINTLDDEMPVVVFFCERTTTAVRLVSKPPSDWRGPSSARTEDLLARFTTVRAETHSIPALLSAPVTIPTISHAPIARSPVSESCERLPTSWLDHAPSSDGCGDCRIEKKTKWKTRARLCEHYEPRCAD